MRIARTIGLVLASSLFIPVSCSTALIPSMHAVSFYDARNMGRGDVPSPFFPVLVEEAGVVSSVPLDALAPHLASHPQASTLLSDPAGTYRIGSFGESSWQSTSTPEGYRRFEVYERGDDYTIRARYLATGRDVTPEYSRLTTPGHLLAGLPLALGFALCVCFAARRWLVAPRVTA